MGLSNSKELFTCIVSQCNHLRKNIRFEKDSVKKIQIITALLMSGLAFKEYEKNYIIAIDELEKFVKSNFDDDGFHYQEVRVILYF